MDINKLKICTKCKLKQECKCIECINFYVNTIVNSSLIYECSYYTNKNKNECFWRYIRDNNKIENCYNYKKIDWIDKIKYGEILTLSEDIRNVKNM